MENKTNSSYRSYTLFSAFFAAVMTILWVNLAKNTFIDTDTGWLLQCLQRFLAGGNYSNNFFETNPPLSFLIYLPVVPFLNQDPQTIKLSLLLTFLAYSFISNICVYFLLKKMELEKPVITLTLISILFSQTWAMGTFSINKDYLIFVFLIPLNLTQYLITNDKIRFTPLSVFSSFLGGLAICLKPHYAIIPAAFLLHRLIKTKNINTIITSVDFITMLVTGASYIAFIAIIFPDYLTIVLPQVIDIYPYMKSLPLLNMAYFIFISLYSALMIGFIRKDTPYLKEISTLTNCSILLGFVCFFAFAIQGKGFFYQAMPFIGYTSIAFFMSTSTLLSNYLAKKYVSVCITYALLSCICLPLLLGFPKAPSITNDKFSQIEFFKKIKELSPNGTYITYDFKPSYLALPYYFGINNGARFGIIWPFDGLNAEYEEAKSKGHNEKLETIKGKFKFFIDMMAEDITNNKPDVICIPRYPDATTKVPSQMLLTFLLKNEKFSQAFKNYNHKETFDFDTGIFMNNVISDDDSSVVMFDLYTLSNSEIKTSDDTKLQ